MKIKTFSNSNKEEKASWILFIAVFVAYSIVSMARNGYAASIASVTAEGIFNKSQAGTINASFYLFYGAAQLLGIKFLDRVSPIKLVTVSILGTIVSTVGMALSESFGAMLFFWSFCGLSQFAVWPAVLRIIAEIILPEHRSRAMVYIAFSYCIGSLVNYIIAAMVLNVARWPMIFWVFTAILLVTVFVWLYLTKKTMVVLEKNEKEEKAPQKTLQQEKVCDYKKLILSSGTMFLLVTAFFRTALDLGVKSWVPTMITESYQGISPSFANILTTFLLIINLLGVFYASWLYPKKIKNIVIAYGTCFLIAIPFTIMLTLTGKIAVLAVVLLLTIVTTMMYAGHQFIDVLIPSYFAKYNRAGSISATINATAAFGSVVGNIAFGYLADKFGWNTTIISWIVIMVASFVFCMCAARLWEKFTQK